MVFRWMKKPRIKFHWSMCRQHVFKRCIFNQKFVQKGSIHIDHAENFVELEHAVGKFENLKT